MHTYLAINLKSYYASAECAARHLDPLTTNLVVADSFRTEKIALELKIHTCYYIYTKGATDRRLDP